MAGSKRSDGVWLFALDGTLQSLPRGSADPPARVTNAPRATAPANRTPDTAHGRELFAHTCIACHGADGTGGIHGAPLTTTALGLDDLMTTIANGRDSMPAFGRVMKPEDLHDVAAYILDEFAR